MIAVVGDLHFGIGSQRFLEKQLDFHYKFLIPELNRRNIKTIKFLGDIFEDRNKLNIFVLNKVLDLFDFYEKEGFDIRIILGNHDTNLKTSNDIHSLKILNRYKNVKIYEKIEVDYIGNLKCLFVPWQYDMAEYIDFVNTNLLDDVKISFGHFDIINCMMDKSRPSNKGFKKSDIMKFPLVFSGHYHTRSFYESFSSKLIYTGTPYSLTRIDKGETKGFYIVDESLNFEFVENHFSPKFVDVVYPQELKKEDVNNNIVDFHYHENSDVDEVERYKDDIYKMEPYSLEVIMIPKSETEIKQEMKFTNLREIFGEYVSIIEFDDEDLKSKFKEKITELFENHYIET